MKRIMTVLMCGAFLFALAIESQAATARVRCRVESGRVRIQVDGLDLAKGTYGAKVKNARTGNIVRTATDKVVTVTISPDDIDLDFDTNIEAHDLDSFVSANFVRAGDTVRASVINIKTGVTVAAASNTCVAK